MRAASDRLHPLVRAIYGPTPIIDMHTRIKVGLKELGIIDNATPRLPLMPVRPELQHAISELIGTTLTKNQHNDEHAHE